LSELKLVSPLLDGFVVGNAMSDHDGIRCYPAMKEGSDDKYILKVISIPASQVQLDALLLTGAYKDPADAMDYFREVADSIVQEAQILEKLSKLDGFLSYEGWQIIPKENGLGNEVYLLGSYKRSLERHILRGQLTHLDAVNLGLDLCQALAICRRSGYLYVDLKPSNVFISRSREYRICDFGFIPMDSLKYAALPGKYCSPYSAPECTDSLQTLNTTADTYSAGMILYQVFNDGLLPTPPADPTKETLPPVNADYEMAAIIMKAIDPDPEKRWADPMEMGQALVAYMQKNSVNNTPLAPKAELVTDPEAPALVREEAEKTKLLPDLKVIKPDLPPIPVPQVPQPQEEEEPQTPEDREEAIAAQISSLFQEEAEYSAEAGGVAVMDPPEESALPGEEDFEEPFLPEELPPEDLLPEKKPSVPAPKPEKVKVNRKPILKKLISFVVTLAILAAIAFGGMWYYQNIYLQNIDDLQVVGSVDELMVQITTGMDETLLEVVCSDTYGNTFRKSVSGGQAHFTGLLPNSQYKITLEVSGFHQLTGYTSTVFNTDAQTNIVSFTAIAGPEDGSVLLNLVVDGQEPETWNMSYSAQGEPEQLHTFQGHSVTIKGLAVGKEYTFTLLDPEDSTLTGQPSVTFTSTELVMAEDLSIIACSNGALTVQWATPEGASVDSWTVRCYNDAGFEQIQENIPETQAVFTGIDTTRAYTVEVTAAGMTQPIRTSITSNPITLTAMHISEDDPQNLEVTWEFEGKSPVGGWLLMYRIDGADKATVVKSDEPTVVIEPRIPNSAYSFEVQAADSTSIFSNTHSFTASGAEVFEYSGLSGDKVEAFLLKTPEDQNWNYDTVSNDDFRTEFDAGESISIILHGTVRFYIPKYELDALYIIRDSSGNACADLTTRETLDWEALWYDGNPQYGELDLPVAPTASGSYTVEIYFNDAIFTTIPFTIR